MSLFGLSKSIVKPVHNHRVMSEAFYVAVMGKNYIFFGRFHKIIGSKASVYRAIIVLQRGSVQMWGM